VMLSSSVFQELKTQVETVIEREKKLKSELKKKEKDLKTELENSKVCSGIKSLLRQFLQRVSIHFQTFTCIFIKIFKRQGTSSV